MRPSASPALPLLLLLLLPSTHAAASTVTIAPAASATPSSQYTNASAFQAAVLSTHNVYRAEHNATALAWNRTIAGYASDWARACAFAHSVQIPVSRPPSPSLMSELALAAPRQKRA